MNSLFFFLFEIIITFSASLLSKPLPTPFGTGPPIGVHSPRRTLYCPSFPRLHRLLCVGCGLMALPILFGMSIRAVFAQLMFGQSCWWIFVGVASDMTRGHTLTANSVILWLLQSFSPLFQCSLSPRSRCMDQAPQCCILISCSFLKRSLSVAESDFDEGWRLHLPVGIRRNTYIVRDYAGLDFINVFTSSYMLFANILHRQTAFLFCWDFSLYYE